MCTALALNLILMSSNISWLIFYKRNCELSSQEDPIFAGRKGVPILKGRKERTKKDRQIEGRKMKLTGII